MEIRGYVELMTVTMVKFMKKTVRNSSLLENLARNSLRIQCGFSEISLAEA
jgi:hypothetical protein